MSEIEYVAKVLAHVELGRKPADDKETEKFSRLAAEAICALDRYRRSTTAPRYPE